jgi:hypothetical protein
MNRRLTVHVAAWIGGGDGGGRGQLDHAVRGRVVAIYAGQLGGGLKYGNGIAR